MMATVHQLYSSQCYEPELLHLLGEALDLACHVLPLGENREAVARAILRTANCGERNLAALIKAGVAVPIRRRA